MRKAVYAGSFDPVTKGHLWMIERGARSYEEFIVGVGINPQKKYTFTLDEKTDMLMKSTWHIPNVSVVSFENEYLMHFAKRMGAEFVLRGLRNGSDFEAEHHLRHMNERLDPTIDSVFMMPPHDVGEISSSFVKGMIGPSGWEQAIEELVPRAVYAGLLVKFRGFEDRFRKLWEREGIEGDSKTAFTELLNRYAERHRAYHTMTHIAHLQRDFTLVRHLLQNPHIVEAALFYHDVIYDPQAGDNEERSAQLALGHFKGSPIFGHAVERNIVATKHLGEPLDPELLKFDPDLAYVLDMDLAIFGSPPAVFDAYRREIKFEYKHYSDAAFREGSKRVLGAFDSRNPIYLTEFFKDKYEAQAHENLKRTIRAL